MKELLEENNNTLQLIYDSIKSGVNIDDLVNLIALQKVRNSREIEKIEIKTK